MRSPFGGGSGSSSSTSDSAEDAQDEFASGGDFFDEPFDPGPQDSAEEAQDDFAGGGGGGSSFDDDDDDDPVSQSTDTAEDAQDAFAGGDTEAPPVRQPVDPPTDTAEDAQDAFAGGDSEAPPVRQPVDPAVEDTAGSAEAAQDALGAGALGSPTLRTEDAAEGAQDLSAGQLGDNRFNSSLTRKQQSTLRTAADTAIVGGLFEPFETAERDPEVVDQTTRGGLFAETRAQADPGIGNDPIGTDLAQILDAPATEPELS